MICRRNAEQFWLMGKISRTRISPERKPQNGRRISQLVHHRHTTELAFDASRPRRSSDRRWLSDLTGPLNCRTEN